MLSFILLFKKCTFGKIKKRKYYFVSYEFAQRIFTSKRKIQTHTSNRSGWFRDNIQRSMVYGGERCLGGNADRSTGMHKRIVFQGLLRA